MTATMELPRRAAPDMAPIKQALPADRVEDPRGEVRRRLLEAGLRDRVAPGARIAITAGSRGMGGFVELLRGIVDAVREVGAEPFLVPAMGSHGGATPEGQVEILRLLGVTEQSIGARVRATMETIELGVSESGATAHLDATAAEADAWIVLGRTSPHPENAEGLSSGLLKMVTVGLGKQRGAQEAHGHGLWASVRAVPKLTLARAKVAFGVATVENGHRQLLALEVVEGTYDAFLESDVRLLELAKAHLATLPFEHLDLLVVDELGKDVSGTGMDLNVIGRWRAMGGPEIPSFRRIVVLSITPASLGNGLGIGLADFTTRRALDAYDPDVTYVNLLTASEPGGTAREGPMPLALPSDRDAIEVALYSALAGPKPRVCRIKNTGLLGEMWVSEGLLDEVEQNARLDLFGPFGPFAFDENGNLF